MRLITISLAAAAATSMLSGCGSTQYYSAEEVRRLGAMRVATERTPAARPIRTVTANRTRATVGARPSENSLDRPWPAAGSSEAQEIAAQEASRERRINEMVNSVCRGC
jgi:hypothetical protein